MAATTYQSFLAEQMFDITDIQDISELLPHDRPMMLLDELLAADDSSLHCALTVREDGLFDSAGSVPAYLGLEYMAQAVAAYSGYQARLKGGQPKVGFLLGTRNFQCNSPRLSCGARLEVSAHCVVQAASGMASFDCQVSGAGIAQSARLSVYEPGDTDAFMTQEAASDPAS